MMRVHPRAPSGWGSWWGSWRGIGWGSAAMLATAALVTAACGTAAPTPTAPSTAPSAVTASAADEPPPPVQRPEPAQPRFGPDHEFQQAEHWAQVFDSPERDAWQKPERVVEALVSRPDLTIVDLGAGTGYFSVRLARAVPEGRVVGLDVEPEMVGYLAKRARSEGLANLESRRIGFDGEGFTEGADLVFVCNTYHHLGDRAAYFRRVGQSLAPGGRLAIVDFHVDSERGPPRHHKIGQKEAEAELVEAGYVVVERHDFLPDQYLIVLERDGGLK